MTASPDVMGLQIIARKCAWMAFALSLGLMISDHMSRHVLSAVFPLIKTEWALSDAALGVLAGIVSATVGLLALPVSLIADRFGRVGSVVLMALIWSIATIGCGIAQDFPQLLIARLFVGVGEAAYGSVGLAILLGMFPLTMRASISSAFLAGGIVGPVLGISVGGVIAAHFGWQWSFYVVGAFGLLLTILYARILQPHRQHVAPPLAVGLAGEGPDHESKGLRLRQLWKDLASLALAITCVGSGLQLFVMGSFMAWLPSYLNRAYALPVEQAGITAACYFLIAALGMAACGAASDIIGKNHTWRYAIVASIFCLSSALCLYIGFDLPPGQVQMWVVGVGMFTVAGAVGPANAIVAGIVSNRHHASGLAILALANNIIGLAAGPVVTGAVADHSNLAVALQLAPLAALGASATFLLLAVRFSRSTSRIRSSSIVSAVSASS